MTDNELQTLARSLAERLENPDKKQLRYNEIIETAKVFYPSDLRGGTRELVEACNKDSLMYTTRKDPMWLTLREQYGWMVADG